MLVLDHVSITVRDLERARPFYDAIMAALGVPKMYERVDALGYGQRNARHDTHSYISIFESLAANPDLRRHWCFRAGSEQQSRRFFDAGLANGGCSDGEPGLRPRYHSGYFAAFLVDPDGNRIEAVYHRGELPHEVAGFKAVQ